MGPAGGRCDCATYFRASPKPHRSRSIDVRRSGLAALLLCGAAVGQNYNPNLSTVIAEVSREIQPEQAMNFMRQVYANDRYFTFPRFHRTAEYLRGAMQSIGLESIQLV